MEHRRSGSRIVLFLGAAMYALFAAFGHQAQHLGGSDIPRALMTAAALFVPVCLILRALFAMEQRRKCAAGGEFRAVYAFCVILVCYVPMFLIAFPGAFGYDVPFQLEQVFTGAYSSHHPLLHTLIMGGCVRLGHALGRINLGAALYTALQIVSLAACAALTCASIARQSGARAAKWSAVFFAVYPLHMMMAVCATKDVLFSGLFALTAALLRERLVMKSVPRGMTAWIAVCGAAMMLMRNNALYAVAVWLVLVLIMVRRRAFAVLGAGLLAVVLYFGANTAMKAATNAAEGDLCEMLSWPIQQMARARNLHGDRLTQEEKQVIDMLMPGNSWQLYDPTISDPVKFEFDTQAFLSDVSRCAQVYLSVGAKCPQAYFDALLVHTYSFWYPYSEYGVSGYYLQLGISDAYYDWCDFERIESRSLFPRVLASLSWRFGAKGAMQIPVIGYLFNMGLIVWVMLYFVLREAFFGRIRSLAAALLPVLLWGTFLLGPVMAGRYIYPFVCVLPVLASVPRGEE